VHVNSLIFRTRNESCIANDEKRLGYSSEFDRMQKRQPNRNFRHFLGHQDEPTTTTSEPGEMTDNVTNREEEFALSSSLHAVQEDARVCLAAVVYPTDSQTGALGRGSDRTTRRTSSPGRPSAAKSVYFSVGPSPVPIGQRVDGGGMVNSGILDADGRLMDTRSTDRHGARDEVRPPPRRRAVSGLAMRRRDKTD